MSPTDDARVSLAQCERVVAESEDVSVDAAAAARFAASAPAGLLVLPPWDDPGMYAGPLAGGVAWLLAYNAINFCYWPDAGPRWWTVVDGVEVGADDEALGIMAAFAAALRDGVPLDDGRFLRDIDERALSALLVPAPGAGTLPMMAERVAGLHALGQAYLTHGGPLGLLALAKGDALGLVSVLATRCGWEDVRTWRGERVVFRKRAQLCTAMIHGWSNGAAGLSGIDRLTVFADYRLPQVLRGVGVMSVSEALAARIEAGEHLAVDEPAEVALRAATLHASELIRRALPGADAIVVDHVLWRTAVEQQDTLPAFHRTRTTAY